MGTVFHGSTTVQTLAAVALCYPSLFSLVVYVKSNRRCSAGYEG